VLIFSYLDEDDPDFALKRGIKSISERKKPLGARQSSGGSTAAARAYRSLAVARAATDIPSRTVWWRSESPTRSTSYTESCDSLGTPTVRIKLVALDTPEFNANMTLTRASVV
jgi:hypothetical protein